MVKYWAMACLGKAISPLQAESKALLAAVQNVFVLGHKNIIIEGGCQVLIQCLFGDQVDFSIVTICNDIKNGVVN